MEIQTLVDPIVTPEIVTEQVSSVQPVKQSSFLIILLSVLLTLSVFIAGFFAFQTQKLVKELTMLRSESTPVATVEPTTEPVATDSANTNSMESWKEYKNDQYGMSFKYPNFLTMEVENVNPVDSGNYILLTFDKSVFVNSFTIKISANAPRRPTILLETEPYTSKKLGDNSWNMYMLSADSGLQMEKNNILYSVIYRNREDLIFQILSTFKFVN